MSTITLPRAVSRWRFSLGGMLLFMLSVSVGLAWWRVPGATVGQLLLGCFGTWFVVGMIGRSQAAWQLARAVPGPTAAMRAGLALAIVAPIGLALLLVFATLMDAAIRVDWFALGEDPDSYAQFGLWIMRKLTDTLMGLAIVCGYAISAADITSGAPGRGLAPASWRRAAWSLATGAAALLLLMAIVFSTGAVLNMVYTALAPLMDYQPLRWAGVDFAPAGVRPRGLERAFVRGGLVCGAVLLMAGVFSVLLARWWRKGLLVRVSLAALAIASLTAAAWLLAWCGRAALPVLSPLMAVSIAEQPRIDLFLGLVVMVSFATIAAWCAATSGTEAIAVAGPHSERSKQPAHLQPAVLMLGMASLLGEGAITWWMRDRYWLWYFSSDVRYNQIEPEQLLRVAAMLLIAAALRRSWRGAPGAPIRVWPIEPGKFACVWLLLFAALLLAPPIGAWFSLALTLL